MPGLNELALEMPAFATYKGGEIDFYVKSLVGNEKSYAVEVKSGKKQAVKGQCISVGEYYGIEVLLRRIR